MIASLPEGLLYQDRHLRIVELNPAASSILGLADGWLPRTPEEVGPWRGVDDDGTPLAVEDHPAALALRTGTPVIGAVMRVARPDGRVIWCRLNAIPVLDGHREPDGVITTFTDLTAEHATQQALASTEAAANEATEALGWKTLHDPLTGLPNRAQIVERLAVALDRPPNHGCTLAVLVLDIDRFKDVNDSMGHDVGDQLLAEVARRLSAAVRSTDVVGRLAGDEFVVLADVLPDRVEAVRLGDRLRAAVARPIPIGQEALTATACVGIAFEGDHRPGTLLRDAETALHKAKEQGRDRCEVFDDSLRAERSRRVAAEQMLRGALDDGGLRVLYQPIVDLRTGTVAAAEALLRILGPSGELLTPASFIRIAEDTGLIVPVGAGVLGDACTQLLSWRADGGVGAPQRVSVNLSARQITTPTFGDVVRRALDDHGLPASALTLELTETTLIEAGHAALDTVEDLHELGVRFAIDDFGTGYSSLSYLKRFPVDEVKIDRSFIAGLGREQDDTEIVRAVLALGQSLGLTTVAEGVETTAQLALLEDLGCDLVQGFLFSRPVSAAELPTTGDHIRTLLSAHAPGRITALHSAADAG